MSYGYSQPQYMPYAPPAPAYGPALRRSAPPGVHVIAILQYLGGALTLVGAAIFAFIAVMVANGNYTTADANVPDNWFNGDTADAVAAIFGVVAGIMFLFGLITIVLARKLQRGRQWARIIVLMLSILSLLSVIATLAAQQQVDASIGGVFFPVLCLILLNTRAARSWFRYHTW